MTIQEAEKMVCEGLGISDIGGLRDLCVTEEMYMETETIVIEGLVHDAGFTYKQAEKIWLNWV